MPTNLTREQMQRGFLYQDPATGRYIRPLTQERPFGGGASEDQAGWGLDPQQTMGYESYGSLNPNEGDSFGRYDAQGTYQGDELYPKQFYDPKLMLIALAAAGGMAALPAMGAAGAGAGAGATTGAGFVGEGALSGIGAWDGALAGAGGAATAGAGGLAAQTASELGALELGTSTAGLSLAENAALAGGATSLLGGAAKYLVPGAAALLSATGGGGGGGGGGEGGDIQKRMDPRMDKYIFGADGQPGLLGDTQNLYRSQMPQAQAVGDGLRNQGASLLNMQPAGNGFGLFTGRRYG